MRHSNINPKSLSKAINVITDFNMSEEIEKKRKIENGETYRDLPKGHPLLIAMENAKKLEQRNIIKNEFANKMKIKRAKRIEMVSKQKEEKNELKKEIAEEYNSKLQLVCKQIADFGRYIEKLQKDSPEYNFSRLRRMLIAAHQGLVRSKIQN